MNINKKYSNKHLKLTLEIQICFPCVHPGCSKNVEKSVVFFWQQDQYFIPSWKIGVPGWWLHISSSDAGPLYVALHELFLQLCPIWTLVSNVLFETLEINPLICSNKLGDTLGVNVICGVSKGGLSKIGSLIRGWAITSIISFDFDLSIVGFSGSIGLIFEWHDFAQPLIFKNSVKSVHFLLQQDQPL